MQKGHFLFLFFGSFSPLSVLLMLSIPPVLFSFIRFTWQGKPTIGISGRWSTASCDPDAGRYG